MSLSEAMERSLFKPVFTLFPLRGDKEVHSTDVMAPRQLHLSGINGKDLPKVIQAVCGRDWTQIKGSENQDWCLPLDHPSL